MRSELRSDRGAIVAGRKEMAPQIVEIAGNAEGNGAGAREGAKREVNGQSGEKTDAAVGPALTHLRSPRLGRSRPFSFAQAIAAS